MKQEYYSVFDECELSGLSENDFIDLKMGDLVLESELDQNLMYETEDEMLAILEKFK